MARSHAYFHAAIHVLRWPGIGDRPISRTILVRTTEEFTLDIRPPAFERIWESHDFKWKHTIEPMIVYSYVNGVNDFGRFIRFDDDETLTDTNEIEYGIRQRLFRKSGDSGGDELVSWDIKEKYFFDPTFGGALIPGSAMCFKPSIRSLPLLSPTRRAVFRPSSAISA